MTETKRHQTQSGKTKGNWVKCPAKQQCRNNGVHVTDRALKTVQHWKTQQTGRYTPLKQVTQSDILAFAATPPETQLVALENYLNQAKTTTPQPTTNLKYPKTVTMADGQTIKTFDPEDPKNKKVGPYYCPKCEKHLSKRKTVKYISGETIACCKTDYCLHDYTSQLNLAVKTDSLWMLDPTQYKNKTFYHSTFTPNWHKQILTDPTRVIHMGDKDAAEHRAYDRVMLNEHPDTQENQTKFDYQLHELQITPPNQKTLPLETDQTLYRDTTDKTTHFTLYLNKYENPGSISLEATADRIKHIKTIHETITKGKLPRNVRY